MAVGIVLAVCLLGPACSDPLETTVTDKAFDLSADWVTITPKDPIVARRNERELQIVLPKDVEAPTEDGTRVLITGGIRATIDAKLIDRSGKAWLLDWKKAWAGYARQGTLLRIPAEGLQTGDIITAVQLRSSSPLRCLGVEWECAWGSMTK